MAYGLQFVINKQITRKQQPLIHYYRDLRVRPERETNKRNGSKGRRKQPRRFLSSVRASAAAAADMSFRISGDDLASLRVERGEELFGTSAAVSDGESDAGDEDHFPDSAGDQQGQHRMFVPQPLRRMNSDSIYDMSSMTAQLPPKKKGLSRYYEGRSQSFACMSEVRSLEDLQKKDNPYKQKKIKPCKSYAALGGGMPKANKAASNSCANLNIVATNGFMAHGIHVNENGYHQ